MEVTREEALRFVSGKVLTNDVRPFARTVVALHDENDRLTEYQSILDELHITDAKDLCAMRECIDRLRDGYRAYIDSFRGLIWLRTKDDFMPMTPEQQAVMAR